MANMHRSWELLQLTHVGTVTKTQSCIAYDGLILRVEELNQKIQS